MKLTMSEFRALPRARRAWINGAPYVLARCPDTGATVLFPVFFKEDSES